MQCGQQQYNAHLCDGDARRQQQNRQRARASTTHGSAAFCCSPPTQRARICAYRRVQVTRVVNALILRRVRATVVLEVASRGWQSEIGLGRGKVTGDAHEWWEVAGVSLHCCVTTMRGLKRVCCGFLPMGRSCRPTPKSVNAARRAAIATSSRHDGARSWFVACGWVCVCVF